MKTYKTIPSDYPIGSEQRAEIEGWIAALRSGEFKQGKQGLFIPKDDSYCCLGVACKRKFDPEPKDHEDQRFAIFKFPTITEGRTSQSSDIPTIWWFNQIYGINPVESVVLLGNEAFSLMTLNDLCHFTFEEIADVIQAVYLDRKEITIEKNENTNQ